VLEGPSGIVDLAPFVQSEGERVRLDEWDQRMTMRVPEVERTGCVLEIQEL
jgi:hypothetical protein